MFTDKQNVLQLIAMLKAHGITQVVLCPGSRDIPIVQGLSQCPEFKCYALTDERSAGFFALGVILKTRQPCAVVVTSGSALLNLHPAACEAFYQQLPLLIISADRAAAWIGQMDGQTMVQDKVLSSVCKHSGTLNEVKDDLDLWHCNRSCNEALLALKREPFAPVHLNVPISDPFFHCPVKELPQARVIRELSLPELCALAHKTARTLLVIGQNSLGPKLDVRLLHQLCRRYTVYAEHLSRACLEDSVLILHSGDLLFDQAYLKERGLTEKLAPDLIITLGGHIISKKLKIFLRGLECRHVHVSPDGACADLFRHLSAVCRASFMDALQALAEGQPGGNDSQSNEERTPYFNTAQALPAAARWNKRLLTEPNSLAHELEQRSVPLSQLEAAGALLSCLKNCTVHLANSSTVRYAEYFALDKSVEAYANRGVNGIEGSLSCAVGAACSAHGIHYMLVGDLSFFYDMNALWQQNALKGLRIMLFNNQGGGIFAALPGLKLDARAQSFVCAPHQTSALPWARERGFNCFKAADRQSFYQALTDFTAPGDDNRLFEVNTNTKDDKAAAQVIMALLLRAEAVMP